MNTAREEFVEEQTIGGEYGYGVDRVAECSCWMMDRGIERVTAKQRVTRCCANAVGRRVRPTRE